MKIHKLVVLVIDFDGLGAEGVRDEMTSIRYPNDCIAPGVVSIETREVEWSDDHPLNKRDTWKQAFEELFK